MIRVTVSYPHQPGSKFDLDYYLNRHMPLVAEKLTPHGMSGWQVEQGLGGAVPGVPAKYQVQVHLNFSTVEAVEAGLGAEAPVLMADVPNFTDTRPEIQIYRVVS